ncbi:MULTISPECIES: hypothetical protein [Rhizobium]|uniref:Uncharacterized protein n=1 Tax=Rhizobium etli TaxID=29449 RepID=A0A7W6ZMW5_RHIET|nr:MULTISPECIES: hypothetical protein [Rhizobium]MBB4483207.1 hypothetical protein [Rhizobium etli]MBB4539035.1 hypothetical protein [Rhizobium etli]PDT07428.1 hypothetical protein CO655_26895 [Rhizobium sp. M1]
MTEIYMLKFYRAAFGDTKHTDVPLTGDDIAQVKEEACQALYTRFSDMKGKKPPFMAALLDEHDHVVARFEVRPVVPGSGEKAFEVPPQLWHDKMQGTPSPKLRGDL